MTRIVQWILACGAVAIAGVVEAQTPGPTMPKVPPDLERKFKQADVSQRGGLALELA